MVILWVKMERISSHTRLRIKGRLAGIVTNQDFLNAVAGAEKYRTEPKIYIGVRRFGRTISINEHGYEGGNGTGINGDCLVAVVKHGVIITMMASHEKNDWYFKRDSTKGLVFNGNC